MAESGTFRVATPTLFHPASPRVRPVPFRHLIPGLRNARWVLPRPPGRGFFRDSFTPQALGPLYCSLGRKRRFLLFGSLNVLITNVCLQVLLRLIPIGLATLFSQLVNLVLGFVLYGKYVFRVNRLRRRSAVLYSLVSALIWVVNWAGILFLVHHGVQRNLAALVMLPLLPLVSYGLQRQYVFP